MRKRHWAAALVYAVLLLLALGLIVVTILPSADTDTWWVRYLDFPRLEFGILILVIGVLLLVVGPGRLGSLALLGLAACLAYDCYILFPYTTLTDQQLIGANTCSDGNRLRLMEVNVEMTNHQSNQLLSLIRQAKPDVVWLQEVDDWWAEQLAPLTADLPNVVRQPRPDYFGVELMSRLRLIDPQIKQLTKSGNPSVFTGVELPSGQLVRLYAIHPRPPQIDQSTAERSGQLMATALAARGDNAPHIVTGDMNAVPWEDIIHRLERVGRFLDPRIGRGMYITWNAKNPILRWPLDQIMPGQDFTLISLQVLPAFGSDHMPYLAEFCYDAAAARDQSPAHLRPNDLGVAKQAVAQGQNAGVTGTN